MRDLNNWLWEIRDNKDSKWFDFDMWVKLSDDCREFREKDSCGFRESCEKDLCDNREIRDLWDRYSWDRDWDWDRVCDRERERLCDKDWEKLWDRDRYDRDRDRCRDDDCNKRDWWDERSDCDKDCDWRDIRDRVKDERWDSKGCD